MRLCILLFFACLLCSCGARKENARSLLNADEAQKYLMDTELTEAQRRAVAAIGIAINPCIDYLSHGLFGGKDTFKPTVTAAEWHQDPITAEKKVIFQAAKAQAANDSWFSGLATWTNAIYAGLTLIFGTAVTAGIKKIMNQGGALTAALEFGRDALAVDPTDETAVRALKDNAMAKKRGTSHAKELDAAMNRMRSG